MKPNFIFSAIPILNAIRIRPEVTIADPRVPIAANRGANMAYKSSFIIITRRTCVFFKILVEIFKILPKATYENKINRILV